MKYILSLLVLFFMSTLLSAQTYRIEGTIQDEKTGTTLPSANIVLKNKADTTKFVVGVSDLDGKFNVEVPAAAVYTVEVIYLGYDTKKWEITVNTPLQDLGNIIMKENAQNLKTFNLDDKMPIAVQNGDTTQYNSDAFKVNKDATAEDLITKMPGITVENGTVKAQGEDVKKVLVDGKEFFGDDAMLTLKNLPADVIDKIQVFDKLSDQAEFSGYNDGNTSKTINIITKKDKLNGQFGKIYGGIGTDYRYIAGGNINLFEGSRKISILGLSNNINQQNFSSEDLVGVASSSSGGGGGNRGGGGGPGGGGPGGGGFGNNPTNNFLTAQQNGVATTHGAGINYTDVWGKKKNINVSGSYFFNATQNTKDQSTEREYLLAADSSQFYSEKNTTLSMNYNHRVNLRFEFNIDTSNSIIFTPKFSIQQNSSQQNLFASTRLFNNNLLNTSASDQTSTRLGYNGGGELLYRHKFAKKGRTISINASGNYNWRNNLTDLVSFNTFYTDSTIFTDSVDQRSAQVTEGYKITGGLGYTEPVGKTGQLSFNYNFGYDWNASLKNTNRYNAVDSTYSIADSLLSSTFNNLNISNRVNAGYGLRGKVFNFNVGVAYENIIFNGSQLFPYNTSVNRIYHNVLPNANFTFRFTKTKNLRIMYRTSAGLPNISQLQTVIDNSNPLLLSRGNKDLLQTYSHTAMIRYNATNIDKATALLLSLAYTYTQNYIANTTYIAENDTTLPDGTFLGKGTQLSTPSNLQGYMNTRAMFTYALPIKKIKTNFSINTSVNYNRLPGMINQQENFSNTISLGQGIGFASNISEKIDFNISYTANYNIVINTLRQQMNNNYFNQTASVKLNWQIYKGLFVNTNLNHYYYMGLNDGFDQNVFLWNASLGYKFLKDESLELKATVFDILGQNNSVTRNVTENYIEDQVSNVLTRYFMVTLTYNLKNFVKTEDKNKP